MPTPVPSVDSSLMQTDSLLKFPLFSFTHSSPTLLNTNMQNLIRMIRRLKLGKLTHVRWIRGVKLYVHWSVFAIAGIMLLGTIERPVVTFVGLFSYLSILLVHECGHMIAAQRRKYKVWSIELYPIVGFCRFEEPWS